MEYPKYSEKINDYQSRLKVPRGWLVTTMAMNTFGGIAVHTHFILDPEHGWHLEGEEDENSD